MKWEGEVAAGDCSSYLVGQCQFPLPLNSQLLCSYCGEVVFNVHLSLATKDGEENS